jgi:hypothetical protein
VHRLVRQGGGTVAVEHTDVTTFTVSLPALRSGGVEVRA